MSLLLTLGTLGYLIITIYAVNWEETNLEGESVTRQNETTKKHDSITKLSCSC